MLKNYTQIFLLVLMLCIFVPSNQAQSITFEIVCPENQTIPEYPTEMRGMMYSVVLPPGEEMYSILHQRTNNQIVDISLPDYAIGGDTLFLSRTVSPNGKYLLFIPDVFSGGTDIAIWEIGTNNSVFVTLDSQTLDYLQNDESELDTRFNTIWTWQSDTSFMLRSISPRSEEAYYAEQVFTIQENPLTIIDSGRIEYPYPVEIIVENIDSGGVFNLGYSPSRNYYSTTQVIGIQNTLTTVYVTNSNEAIATTADFAGAGLAQWAPNEQFFAIAAQNMNNQSMILTYDVRDNFAQSLEIQDFINQNIIPSYGYPAVQDVFFDPTSTYMIVAMTQNILLYDIPNRSAKVICNPFGWPNTNWFSFWGADSTYFGLWNGGILQYFDLTTGEAYQVYQGIGANPEKEAIRGWLNTETIVVPTATPSSTPTIPTNTPTNP